MKRIPHKTDLMSKVIRILLEKNETFRRNNHNITAVTIVESGYNSSGESNALIWDGYIPEIAILVVYSIC